MGWDLVGSHLLHGSTFPCFEATQYSITRCIIASKYIIAGYEDTCEFQRNEGYRCYTYGLASFYASHAAMALKCLILNPAHVSHHVSLYTTLEAS